ncbi:MAG: ABC transporter permease [Spirochaetales bacterium]|nr:ABC transporter permease [Spirochaetales bacterium]
MKLGKIALRNLKRNKKRSILSLGATMIATYAIVFMFSFIGGLNVDMQNVAKNYNSGEILLRNVEYDDVSFSLSRSVSNYNEIINLLKKEFPLYEFSPRLKFPSTVFDNNNSDRSYISIGIGVNFQLEKVYLNIEDKIVEGTLPQNSREVLMGIGLANELGLGVGDKFTPITMTKGGASTGITFKVSGLARYEDAGFTNKTFLAPLDELPNMLKMEGSVTDILIKNVGDENLEESITEINSVLQKNGYTEIIANSWKDIGIGYSWMQMASFAYTIIGTVFFLLASTVIANTMLMVVFERRKEIGTITALGMTEVEVIRLFFTEALMLGLIGAALGVILGVITIIPLSFIGLDLSSATGDIDIGSSFFIYPKIKITTLISIFLYSVFIASFVSFFPSKGAAKVDPIVALRSE